MGGGRCGGSGGDSDDDNTPGADDYDQQKYGDRMKHDPTFKGPIQNRGCTDVICCLFFIVCFLGFLAVGGWAYIFGDPYRLLYPSDSEGNVCGVGDYSGRPYVFFFDFLDCVKVGPAAIIGTGCPTPQVCVSSCPNETFLTLLAVAKPSLRDDVICQYNVDKDSIFSSLTTTNATNALQDLVSGDKCAAYYIQSTPIFGRCVPSVIASVLDDVVNGNISDKYGNAINVTLLGDTSWLDTLLSVQSYGEKTLSDVRSSWQSILIGLAIGALLSFIWILLMRWIAGVIIWFTLIAFIGLFSFSTYFSFTKYFELKANATEELTVQDIQLTTSLDYYADLYYTWLAIGILSAVFLAIILLIMLCLCQRICIAIELIKESSRAVGGMMFTLIWPIFPFIMQLVVLLYWGATVIFLASIGDPVYGSANVTLTSIVDGTQNVTLQAVLASVVPCDSSGNSTGSSICSFIKYGGNEYTIYLQFFSLFMFFWLMNFVIALGQMTLAGSFASYYWAFKKPDDIPYFPLLGSLGRCLRYHLGTLAFGSLIIAIIQLIRVILEYIDHKLKDKKNAVVTFILCCLKCCFWCLEKFMKWINVNAYILVAVYGKNFCTSAKNAFMLLMRNIVRVVVIDQVTDYLLFVGKLVVTGIIVLLGFYFYSGDFDTLINIDALTDFLSTYRPTLEYYFIPIIIIGIGTYFISCVFFGVYDMAVDTLFLCFLEDLERHDGSEEKPYYMSKGLMKILGKKNKKDKNKNKKK